MKASAYDLVLTGYRPRDTQAAIRFCNHAFARSLVGNRLLVLNSRALSRGDFSGLSAWDVTDGSNDLGEFSGWQEGLDHLRRQGGQDSGVIFVNDTLTTHRYFSWPRRSAFVRALRRHARSDALVGFRDAAPGQLEIAGLPVASWASTYCFALTGSALRRLDERLYDAHAVSSCVLGGLDEARFFARLSPDLEAHLRHWLFDGLWYGGGRLTAENAQRLEFKASCIVAEKLLSARAAALSIDSRDPFKEAPALRSLDERLGEARWRTLHAIRVALGRAR